MPQNVKELLSLKVWLPQVIPMAMLLFAAAYWKAKTDASFIQQTQQIERHAREIERHSERIQNYDVLGTEYGRRMNSMQTMQIDAMQKQVEATSIVLSSMRDNNTRMSTDILWIRESLQAMRKEMNIAAGK